MPRRRGPAPVLETPTLDNNDSKSYLRCCISCKQPWHCDASSVKDNDTYIAYGVDNFYKKYGIDHVQGKQLYFGADVNVSHILQKAHQAFALAWINSDPAQVYDQPTIEWEVDPKNWGSSKRSKFRGRWPQPEPRHQVQHPKLRDFLQVHSAGFSDQPSLPSTLLCCQKCNDIMDTRAKLRRVLYGETEDRVLKLRGIIPADVLEIKDGNQTHILPQPMNHTWPQEHLVFLYGWYLHASMLYVGRNHVRTVKSVLVWLALRVHTTWLDWKKPETGSDKPVYTFIGVLNLFISLYQYVMMCAEFPGLGISFPYFHTFMFLEMPECPVEGFWDSARYMLVHEYVTRGMDMDLDRPARETLLRISDRLVEFYQSHTRVVVRALWVPVIGDLSPNVVWFRKFFVSREEVATIMRFVPDLGVEPSKMNLRAYIQAIGVVAVLWPFRRFVFDENVKGLAQAIDEWIQFDITLHEVENIRHNRKVNRRGNLRKVLADLAWKVQYMGDEMSLDDLRHVFKTVEPKRIGQVVMESERCSVYKAVVRLLQLGFHDSRWRNAR